MAERVKVGRLTPAERQRLQPIVRRGESKRGGRYTILVIARLVAADADTVREVNHRFNGIGLERLGPGWAGGLPRPPGLDDEKLVARTSR